MRLIGAYGVAALNDGAMSIDWKAVESRVIQTGIEVAGVDGEELAQAICSHSPGAVMSGRQAAVREAVRVAAEAFRRQSHLGPPAG